MHGDLSNTTLAAICRALACDGATGRLVLDGAEGPGSVILRDGAIAGVWSPRPRARLAGRLTGGGHLDELTLAQVHQDLRHGRRGTEVGSEVVDDLALAGALLQRGLVDPVVVRDVLVGQLVDGMVELRAQTAGRYGFEPSGPGGPRTTVGPLVDVETLLEEVREREDRIAGLPPAARRPDTVPHRQVGAAGSDGHLGADAVTVLGAIDDRRNLEDLARALGYGRYDLACILADLSERGVVTLADPVDEIDVALDLDAALDLVDVASTSGPTLLADDADDHPPVGDPGATARASESITEASGQRRLPPEPPGRVEDDTDVSEFLRELSSLARGDDAPPTRRISAAAADDAPGPADGRDEPRAGRRDEPRAGGRDETRTASTADAGAAEGPGAPRARDATPEADGATDRRTDRRTDQRRRRRLFGRG